MVPVFRLQPLNTRVSLSLLRRHSIQKRSHTFLQLTNGHSVPFSPSTNPHPLRSGTSSVTLAVILVSAVFAAGGSFYLRLGRTSAQPSLDTEHRSSTPNSHNIITMANSSLPGRPGNLTADQEAKLQELWTATMRVFGISASERLEDAGGDTEDSRPSTPSLGVKKKKRHNVFSRKPHDNEDDGKLADQGDKYGQSKEFQQILATANPEDLRRAFWDMAKHDHPDALLLRFLRARKWDVHNALVMLIATMKWRLSDMRVDEDIMKKGEAGALADSKNSNAAVKREGNDFLAQLRLGKSFLHGTDKAGRPICFVRVRLHRQGEQTEASLERYTVYVIETARLVLARPVDTAAVLFDMTGFSMANMDYTPVKFMIKCFEANYPESLGVVLVHKSPWIFQSIWNIIKGWLDPVVASKVHFTKNLEELEQFVEKSHIIKELGGDDPWEYQYIEPQPEENDRMSEEGTKKTLLEERAIVVKEFEAATQEWIGSNHNKPALQEKRAELAEKLRTGYWQLDPYLRARSLYDRSGMIKEGGTIEYYGEPQIASAPKPLVASQENGIPPTEHRSDDVD